MNEDLKQKNNTGNLQNSKFIYGEACKSHEQQQCDIEHLNNKFNWIIAINVFALGFILKMPEKTVSNLIIVALFLFLASFIFSLMSLWARIYKRGPKLTEMLDKTNWSYEQMLEKTNKVLVKNIDFNYNTVRELKLFLKLSIGFLVCGLIMLIFNSLIT